jgi:aspartyl protease family protein
VNDAPEPRRDGIAGMGRGMLAVFWVLVLAGGTWLFSGVLEREENPNGRVEGTRDGEVAEVRLQANGSGHYVATGTINGEPARMLLDTGATSVVVPVDFADAIGLERGPRVPVNTANGRSEVWMTRIDRLRLGTLEFRDVEAAIAPGLDDAVLLGMSALGSVEMTQRAGELVIRQTR